MTLNFFAYNQAETTISLVLVHFYQHRLFIFAKFLDVTMADVLHHMHNREKHFYCLTIFLLMVSSLVFNCMVLLSREHFGCFRQYFCFLLIVSFFCLFSQAIQNISFILLDGFRGQIVSILCRSRSLLYSSSAAFSIFLIYFVQLILTYTPLFVLILSVDKLYALSLSLPPSSHQYLFIFFWLSIKRVMSPMIF